MPVISNLHLWEDASESFCLLKIAEYTKSTVILLFDANGNNAELSYAKRFINTFKDINLSIFFVLFDINNKIIDIDNRIQLLHILNKKFLFY